MKSVVIPVHSQSEGKLLIELAKKMGLQPRLQQDEPMDFEYMPEDDNELRKMLDKAEANFKKGNYLTTREVEAAIKKWK